MEALCGDYYEDMRRRRRSFSWVRLVAVLLILSSVTVATPAVISYYWDGRNSDFLSNQEMFQLVDDPSAHVAMRRSAVLELYARSRDMIRKLQEARDIPELRSHSEVYLGHLRRLVAQ